MLTSNNAVGLLVEKYRPAIIDHCVLPKSLKDTFNSIVESGECPNLLLAGKPGMGNR